MAKADPRLGLSKEQQRGAAGVAGRKKKVVVKKKQDAHERQPPSKERKPEDAHERAKAKRKPTVLQDAHERQPRKYRGVQSDAATRTYAQIIRERNMRSRHVRDPEFTRDPQSFGRRFEPRRQGAGFSPLISQEWAETQLRDLGHVAVGLGKMGLEYGEAIPLDVASLVRGKRGARTTDLLWRDAQGMAQMFKQLATDPSMWKEHTVLSALMGLPVAGAGVRVGSRAALTRSIRRANTKGEASVLNVADASKLAPEDFIGRKPGESIVLHGTTEDVAAAFTKGKIKLRGDDGRVFVSSNPGEAIAYAERAARERGVAPAIIAIPRKHLPHQQRLEHKGVSPTVEVFSGEITVPVSRLSLRKAFQVAGKESRTPGYAALHGYEGGIKPRVLKGKYGEATGRMQSFHPLGRGGQKYYDYASSLVEGYFGPGAAFSTSRRAARSTQKQSAKRIQREDAVVARAEKNIRAATVRRGRRQEHVEEALQAVLEAPTGLSARQAVETKIRHLASLEQTPGNQAKIAFLEKSLQGQLLERKGFTGALEAEMELSQMASRFAAHQGIESEVIASRQNRIAEAWAEAGLLPEGVQPIARGYFPHRGEFETIPGGVQPTGMAAAGDVIGVPKPGRALERRRNELLLYGSGKISSDPKVLANTVRGRIKFAATQERRQWLWDNSLPLIEGAKFERGRWTVIRNPDADPVKIPDAVKAALRDPDRFFDEGVQTWKNEWLRPVESFDSAQALLEWAGDLNNVRIVPAQVAKALIDDVFTSAPRGRMATTIGTLNQLVRSTVLYLPDLGVRYVARNAPQNMLLLGLTQPRAYARLGRDLRKFDKKLWDAVKVETGAIRASAGLPERLRGATPAQRVEKGFNDWSRRFANRLGDVADEPFRVSAWLEYARKYDLKTPAEWRKLLDSDDPAWVRVRDQIGQKVREDLIDFDALTPAERETISRFAFIYAFKRGAVKWPAMYLREYPERAAILSLAASQQEREGIPGMPQSVAEAEKYGDLNFGWLTPWNPFAEDVESAVAQARLLSEGRINLTPVTEYLGPFWRELGEAAFEGGVKPERFANVILPGYRNITRLQRGGTWDEILKRELGMAVETPEFRKKQRAEQRTRLEDAWSVAGDRFDSTEIATAFNAHETYKDIRSRAEFAAKDLGRKLTEKEKALLMTEVAREYRPDLDLPDNEAIKAASGHGKYIEALEEVLWGTKTKLLSAATRERNKSGQ